MKRITPYLLLLCFTLSLVIFTIPNALADDSLENMTVKPSIGLDTSSGPTVGPGIRSLQKDSLADKAGIREGDIIVSVGGIAVKTADDVAAAWKSYVTGNKIEFELTRRGRKYSTEVTKSDSQSLGISIYDSAAGALVKTVHPGGPAEKAGIEKKDLIVGLNGETVIGPGSINKILENCSPKEIVEIEYFRGDTLTTTKITLGSSEFSISDITVLTSTVKAGDSIPLFSLEATGDLNIKKAFSWFHEDPKVDFWLGITKRDKELGVRVENIYNEETGIYTSTLWADNISSNASGYYFCSISDYSGATMKSNRVNIQVY